MTSATWEFDRDGGPVVGVALHAGHVVDDELIDRFAVDEATRLREEDPYTDELAEVFATHVIGRKSRFQFDLNRPREKAVYITPADAWAIEVWKSPPEPEVLARSLVAYDGFYRQLEELLGKMASQYGRVVVFDLHSYNHRRAGPNGPPTDPTSAPEINLGTRTMDRSRWAGIVDGVLEVFRSFEFLGRRLDARENVNFFGGHMAAWCHASFPESVCVLAVEVKKFFMNEWTGQVDRTQLDALRGMVGSAGVRVTELLGAEGG